MEPFQVIVSKNISLRSEKREILHKPCCSVCRHEARESTPRGNNSHKTDKWSYLLKKTHIHDSEYIIFKISLCTFLDAEFIHHGTFASQ